MSGCHSASRRAACTASWSRTSTLRAWIACRVFHSPRLAAMSSTRTVAPSRSSRSTTARPMPPAPPVTTAIRPARPRRPAVASFMRASPWTAPAPTGCPRGLPAAPQPDPVIARPPVETHVAQGAAPIHRLEGWPQPLSPRRRRASRLQPARGQSARLLRERVLVDGCHPSVPDYDATVDHDHPQRAAVLAVHQLVDHPCEREVHIGIEVDKDEVRPGTLGQHADLAGELKRPGPCARHTLQDLPRLRPGPVIGMAERVDHPRQAPHAPHAAVVRHRGFVGAQRDGRACLTKPAKWHEPAAAAKIPARRMDHHRAGLADVRHILLIDPHGVYQHREVIEDPQPFEVADERALVEEISRHALELALVEVDVVRESVPPRQLMEPD